MFAAVGADSLIRSHRGAKIAALSVFSAALVIGGLGICLWQGSLADVWSALLGAIASARESYLAPGNYSNPGFIAETRSFAATQCLVSAAILLVVGALFWMRTIRTGAAYWLIIFGVVEIFLFAHSTLVTFRLAQAEPARLRDFMNHHPGDCRIKQRSLEENRAMVAGADDIWGYDPALLRRYAELMTFSQHESPDQASEYLDFWNYGPLLRLVRLRYVFRSRDDNAQPIEKEGALPHLLLLSAFTRIPDRDHIFDALISPSFDPLKTAILESDPSPAPASTGLPGRVELLRSDNGSLTISASVAQPTLLLITDSYSRYWCAVALKGSSQNRYTVLPADYALMAVPLAAGTHLLRLEYAPSGYTIGRWITIVALAAYLLALAIYLRRRRGSRASAA